jgi:DNA helicase-2/ATP-dependent DNA helicase PcrA
MACDENLDRFDSREVNAATRYEQMLHETHRIDFEAMTSRTLQLVKTDQRIRDLTAARFPHVIVDEYQDLGGVLHGIVSALRDEAGIEVFAVGDPDQSIFGYAGADPRYLEELCDRPDFHVVDLQVNYRSGRRIIVASEAGLGRPRGRKAHEQSAPGEVRIVDVGRAGLGEHAVEAASAVRATLDAGVAPERVAVVYPSRGLLPTRIAQELLALEIPYQFEQDDRLPTGAVSSFVQGCASRTVISSRVRGATVDDARALLVRTSAPTLAALYTHLLRLRSDAALPPPRSRLESLRTMQVVVDPTIPIDTATPAETWMDQLVDAMDLERIFASHPEGGSGDALRQVQEIVRARSLSVEDLAAGQEIIGKVVLTTYHSSKGREFHTVVLPGLVDGYFPMNVRLNGTWTLPRGRQLDAVRRQFYVGLSRAEQVAVLITGMTYENRGGSWRSPGRSRLVRDVESALELA